MILLLSSADEVHQLDRIAVLESGICKARAANDLPIELLHDHARVQIQLAQKIGERCRAFNRSGFAVHG
jgi:hypothetical protein